MFIVIDGIDGAGKSTQLELLKNYLENLGKTVKKITYPNYESDSCFFVKKYLNGGYGNSLGAKEASLFFALDRFDSKKSLLEDLQNYDYVISDRYVSANMIHQGGKILDREKRKEFLNWIYDLEYNILSLPKPDLTIFLNISVELSRKLISSRESKNYIKSSSQKDIHEEDLEHLQNAKNAVEEVVKMQENFRKIECEKDGKILTREEILEKIIGEIFF